jgi:hypothetical protein
MEQACPVEEDAPAPAEEVLPFLELSLLNSPVQGGAVALEQLAGLRQGEQGLILANLALLPTGYKATQLAPEGIPLLKGDAVQQPDNLRNPWVHGEAVTRPRERGKGCLADQIAVLCILDGQIDWTGSAPSVSIVAC